jgi:hypothetical protein
MMGLRTKILAVSGGRWAVVAPPGAQGAVAPFSCCCYGVVAGRGALARGNGKP